MCWRRVRENECTTSWPRVARAARRENSSTRTGCQNCGPPSASTDAPADTAVSAWRHTTVSSSSRRASSRTSR
jgi:hypothetical protein